MRTTMIFLSIILVSIIVTHLLHIAFRKKYVKYIPSIILIILVLYTLIKIKLNPSSGFEDLGRIVMVIFFLSAAIPSIIYGIFLDVILTRFKDRR